MHVGVRAFIGAGFVGVLVAGCVGIGGRPTPRGVPNALHALGTPGDTMSAAANTIGPIALAPSRADVYALGSAGATRVAISEPGYTGTFSTSGTCARTAAIVPKSGRGPVLHALIEGLHAGSCRIVVADAGGHRATLGVTVTSATLALSKGSVASSGRSVAIWLQSVNGAAPPRRFRSQAVSAVRACAGGCAIAGLTALPGVDAYLVRVYDRAAAKGNVLAAGLARIHVRLGRTAFGRSQLGGVVGRLAFSPDGGACAITTACSTSVQLQIMDADGDDIAGSAPYVDAAASPAPVLLTVPNSVTLEDASGAAAPTTISAPTQNLLAAVVYNGMLVVSGPGDLPGGALSVSAASGVATATFGLALRLAPIELNGPAAVLFGPPSQPGYDYSASLDPNSPSASFTVSEAQYDGSFSIAPAFATEPGYEGYCEVPPPEEPSAASFGLSSGSGSAVLSVVAPDPSNSSGLCGARIEDAFGGDNDAVLNVDVQPTATPLDSRAARRVPPLSRPRSGGAVRTPTAR